ALVHLLGRRGSLNHHRPDFDGLPLGDYLAPGFILPYAASSGCYWNKCSFCPEKAEKNPYTSSSTDRVLNDIDLLKQRTNPSMLHFLDNAISPALLRSLASTPPDLDWYGFARVHHALADVDFCRALRKSGCVMLKLGLESGNQDILDSMNKGIDLDMVAQALAALRSAGIGTYVYLLFGTPSESIVQARDTLDFVVDHTDAITYLNLAIFNMPICSPEADTLEVSGFFEGDLSLYTDFFHPHGWNRKAIRRFLDHEFKRHPAVASILRRDPPYFTSNHAPFFVGNLSGKCRGHHA
ncbi:MAG: radical SAM protein, partial [Desulfobulbaceae bacterium]|nr:radical SAM protein [Desulfobulbaceae bacterium]